MQEFGISVSLVQPGYVSTQMGAKAHKDSDTSYGVGRVAGQLMGYVCTVVYIRLPRAHVMI